MKFIRYSDKTIWNFNPILPVWLAPLKLALVDKSICLVSIQVVQVFAGLVVKWQNGVQLLQKNTTYVITF